MWPVPKWWVVQPGMSSGWDLEGPTWWCAAVCSHAAWAVARGIRDAGSSGHVGREPPVDSRSGGANKLNNRLRFNIEIYEIHLDSIASDSI